MKTQILLVLLALGVSELRAQGSQGHWELVTSPGYPDSVVQIVAASGPVLYAATAGKGVFKSTDEGENWITINKGLETLEIASLVRGPHGELLAETTPGAIYFSSDDNNWRPIYPSWLQQYPGAHLSAGAIGPDGKPYIGSVGAGVWRNDSSYYWTQVATPSQIPGVEFILFDSIGRLMVSYDQLYRLKADFSGLDHVWPEKRGRLLKSTWGPYLVGTEKRFASDSIYEIHDTTLVGISTVAPADLTLDSIGNMWSWSDGPSTWPNRSSDHGKTWVEVKNQSSPGYPLLSTEAASFGFISSAPSGDQLSVSFDSAWTFHTIRPLGVDSRVDFVGVDRSGNIQATDQDAGLWSSSDHGVSWNRRMSNYPLYYFLATDGKYYAKQLINGNSAHWKLFMSEDGGITPITLNTPPPPGGTKALDGFYVAPSGNLYLCCDSGYLLRSVDHGNSWNVLMRFDSAAKFSSPVYSVMEAGNFLYVCALTLNLSMDNGATWSQIPNSFGSGTVLQGNNNDFFLRQQNGFNWLQLGDPLSAAIKAIEYGPFVEDMHVNILSIYPNDQSSYNPASMLTLTSRSGHVIDTLAAAPPTGFVTALALDSSGFVFASVEDNQNHQYPFYRLVLGSSGVRSTAIPSSSTSVTISEDRLDITCTSNLMSIDLLDATGRRICTSTPNSRVVSESLTGLPNGFYLLRITTSAGVDVHKLAIVR